MKTRMKVGETGGYDEICTRLAHDLKARAVVLIVVGGRLKEGNGMSVAIDRDQPGAIDLGMGGELSALLRGAADFVDSGMGPGGVSLVDFSEEN